MEQEQNEGQTREVDRSNVVDLASVRSAVRPKPPQEQFFTDEERREIREMLAYYRKARPEFEAMKQGCPTARHLLDLD